MKPTTTKVNDANEARGQRQGDDTTNDTTQAHFNFYSFVFRCTVETKLFLFVLKKERERRAREMSKRERERGSTQARRENEAACYGK